MTTDTLKGYCAALRDQVLHLYEALNTLVVELENQKRPKEGTGDAPIEDTLVDDGPCVHPVRRRRVLSRENQPLQFLCEACQSIIEETTTL